jgi:hypothetical protein
MNNNIPCTHKWIFVEEYACDSPENDTPKRIYKFYCEKCLELKNVDKGKCEGEKYHENI